MTKPITRATTGLRLLLGVVCLGALFYFHLVDLESLRLATTHPMSLVVAIVLLLATLPLSGLRWHILLKSQNIEVGVGVATAIVTASAFFNNFLPGAYGGDLVRGAYAFQADRGRRTAALLSVVVDRTLGLGGLLLAGSIAAFGGTSPFSIFDAGIFAATAIYTLALVSLLVFGHRAMRSLASVLGRRLNRVARIIDDLSSALGLYLRAWRSVATCVLLSFIIFLLTLEALAVIATAMQPTPLSAADYSIAGVGAMAANILPLTPGGLGFGEGAFAKIAEALEAAPTGYAYGSIFLVFRCLMFLASLPGLVAFAVIPIARRW